MAGEEFTIVFRGKQLAEVEETLRAVREGIEDALVEVFDPK